MLEEMANPELYLVSGTLNRTSQPSSSIFRQRHNMQMNGCSPWQHCSGSCAQRWSRTRQTTRYCAAMAI